MILHVELPRFSEAFAAVVQQGPDIAQTGGKFRITYVVLFLGVWVGCRQLQDIKDMVL